MSTAAAHPDVELARLVGQYYDDPLGFVLDCYPWGKADLAGEDGPDTWQREILQQIGAAVRERRFNGSTPVPAIRFSRASGHGIGKSTLISWLANWIMSTRPDSQGTVTANTFTQLETKTWAAIQRWTKLCITKDWWIIGARGMYQKDHRPTWFLNCQTCSEENSEAFAGQHAKNSTSYYLCDESSGIPDKTWEVMGGGMTDGEPHIYCFGNPTRNTGEFYEINFGRMRHRWNYGSIDSRSCKFSNKQEIDELIQDYGIDSDRVRVRVLGLPPNTAEDQLIGRELIQGAQKRPAQCLDDDPLVAGVDVPDGGSAWFIVRFRRGLDARNVPAPIRVAGSRIDRQQMITQLATVLAEGAADPVKATKHRVSAMFIDAAFGAPIVERLHSLGYQNVHEINFGGKSPDPRYANMRAFMWAKQLREWLAKGAIVANDTKLESDLMGPGFEFRANGQLVVESKADMAARGIPSPDDGDALALTFARPVAPTAKPVQQQSMEYSPWA